MFVVFLGPGGGVLGSRCIPGCPLSLAQCGWQDPTRRKSRRPSVDYWCPADRAWRARGRVLNWKYFRDLQPQSLPAQGPVPLRVALLGLESIFWRLITPCLVHLRDCLVSVWGQQATCLHPEAFMLLSGSTFLILHSFLGKCLPASSA